MKTLFILLMLATYGCVETNHNYPEDQTGNSERGTGIDTLTWREIDSIYRSPKNPVITFIGEKAWRKDSLNKANNMSNQSKGNLPLVPLGMEETEIKHELTKEQRAFVDTCIQEGMTGCTLTINGTQTYVSFYKNAQK